MADGWSDPSAAGAIYTDPTAPVYIAPIMLTEPDPVYRDDALFASSSANWRAAPVPPPPLPVLNEAGELVLVVEPPTPAELRTQAVDALHAPPPGGPVPVASRGGARSTYSAPAPAPAAVRMRRPAPPVRSLLRRRPGCRTRARPSHRRLRRPDGDRPTGVARGGRVAEGRTDRCATCRRPPSRGVPVRRRPPGSRRRSPRRPGRRRTGIRPARRRVRPRTGRRPASLGPCDRVGRGRRTRKGWIPWLVILAFIIVANVAPARRRPVRNSQGARGRHQRCEQLLRGSRAQEGQQR